MGNSMSLYSMRLLDMPCSSALSPARPSFSSPSLSSSNTTMTTGTGRSTEHASHVIATPPSTPVQDDSYNDDGDERHSPIITTKNSVNSSQEQQAATTTKEEYTDDHNDLTMGDIAMLSTARPSIDPGYSGDSINFIARDAGSSSKRTAYPRGAPSLSSSSLRRDIDMPRGMHSYSTGIIADATTTAVIQSMKTASILPQEGARMHAETQGGGASSSSPSNAYTTATTRLPSLPHTATTAPSSSGSSAMQSLLTSSRNILPPLPSLSLDTDPSTLPPLPRIPMSTSSSTVSSALPSASSVQAHVIPPSSSSSAQPVSAPVVPPLQATSSSSSSSATTSAPAPTAATKAVPHHVHTDGRYKRYIETQMDYKPGGYARIGEGDRLNHGRYEIVKKLGVGHFSVVWLAWDREDGGYVAIKVVRSSRRYARAAHHEDKLLTVIQGPRDERKNYIVSFLNSFEERSWEGPDYHVCLVFEVMGMSLTDVLRKNDFDGLPVKTTKLITKQVLTGLSYLHSLGIAHTDIKPDNILLYHSSRSMSKILRTQLEADDEERERQEAEEALNPKPEPINWLEYKPKIPGLNPQQIREIQLARIRAESRKWTITPSMPLDSPIPFANGKKIVKEFVLANKHLYKRYPNKTKSSQADSKSIEHSSSTSGSQSAKNSLEIDRTSVAHPVTSTDNSTRIDHTTTVATNAETASTQNTPTKDVPSATASTHASSPSPKGKGTDTTNTTESSMTAPSSRQSSKSPYSSLGRLRPSHVNTAAIMARDSVSPYTAIGRTFDRMSMSDFLKHAQHADDMDVGNLDHGRSQSIFGSLKHPRTSSNGSSGQQSGETDFERLLRQPMEYDIPGGCHPSLVLNMNPGGPSPIFMQKSPSDAGSGGGSEIFSPASTTMTRYFHTASGASSTDSPASLASTPAGSSPELHMARKLPSPIFPHPGAVYSTAVPIPRHQPLTRTGSAASIFASSLFNSFSPAEHILLQDQEYKGRGGADSVMHPGLPRARSDFGLEDGQAFMPLPSSPPSHPTSYISVASLSPEVTLRKGSGSGVGLSGLTRSGSDASLGMSGTFDFAIQEEDEGESALRKEFGAKQGEDANTTLTSATQPPRVLPCTGSNVHDLGMPTSASSKALAIPGSNSRSSDALSPLTSASPPTSMTSSMVSRASDTSSQSPPVQTTLEPPRQPKIEKLASPARVRSDPLLNVHVKLSDLGNAIYYNELKSKGGLPENVCTRQYRPPENIIGAEYNLGVDVWALGCVIFEMITGEMLFNPSQEKYRYTKEDDLLGQQIEILGAFSPEFALSGRKSMHFFSRHGQLLRVRLNPWLLLDVMIKKYYMPRAKAQKFCDFLLRMLEPDPAKRATVEELLQDPWLNEIEEDDDMVLYRERKKPPVVPAEAA